MDAATESVEPLYLAGREAARRFSYNQGRVWAAIGVDYQPCPMSCRFCSFGEAWGIIKSRREWPHERIEVQAVEFANQGAHWLPVLVFGLWELATAPGGLPEYVLPGPRALALTTWDFFWGTLHRSTYSGTFWRHAIASLERVAAGFLLAAFIGIPLGLAAGSIANIRRLVDMTIQAIRSVPGIGWLPLAIVWFGIGTKTTVFLIALAGFFPVYVNSVQGARHVRDIWKRAAFMLGADRWSIFTTVILPGAMPAVVSGLRVALGLSWAYLVLGELTGVPDGLGAVIMDARMLGQVDMIIVGMISIALLGRLSDRLLLFLLGRLVWRREMV